MPPTTHSTSNGTPYPKPFGSPASSAPAFKGLSARTSTRAPSTCVRYRASWSRSIRAEPEPAAGVTAGSPARPNGGRDGFRRTQEGHQGRRDIPHQQDRGARAVQHGLGNRAEDQPPDATATVAGHDDEIDLFRRRRLDDRRRRGPIPDRCTHPGDPTLTQSRDDPVQIALRRANG